MKRLLLALLLAASIAQGQERHTESLIGGPASNEPGPIGTLAGNMWVDGTLNLKIANAGRWNDQLLVHPCSATGDVHSQRRRNDSIRREIRKSLHVAGQYHVERDRE